LTLNKTNKKKHNKKTDCIT